jgi:hypothetical protein
MAKWTMDLKKYAEKQKVKIQEVRKSYAFALYSSIVKKTPVDTGRARGNWNVAVGSEDTSTSATQTTPKYTDPSQIPEPKGDESIFISNNLPYITKLEYGGYPKNPKRGHGKTVDGFSKQAPQGMVGVTLANNENIFNSAVEAVRDSQ